MNIYITETKIITSQQPPLEEHALIGKYTKQLLLDTVKEYPDLEHNCPIYRFYHPENGLVQIVDLAAFAKQINSTTARLNQIKQYKGKVAKGWMFIPPEEEIPQAYYNYYSNKRSISKKSFASSLGLRGSNR